MTWKIDGIICLPVAIDMDKNSILLADGFANVVFDTSKFISGDTSSFYRAAYRWKKFIGPKEKVRIAERDREADFIYSDIKSYEDCPIRIPNSEMLLALVEYRVKSISASYASYGYDPDKEDIQQAYTYMPFDSLRVRSYMKTLYSFPSVMAVGIWGFWYEEPDSVMIKRHKKDANGK